MSDEPKLTRPLLVAVWPGMGHVALNAGVYLLAKLNMTALAEIDTGEQLDVTAVEVVDGLIQPARRPRSRFFAWSDPRGRRDLLLFLGEAQPPVGKFAFCKRVVEFARGQGVERVITFAAMATDMRPEHPSRVFGAATDLAGVDELRARDLTILKEGNIGGLNGVLLGAAAQAGLRGACYLGEMPQVFAQVPFPKASLAILEVFAAETGLELDLDELAEQARSVEEQLGELLSRVEEQYGPQTGGSEADEGDEGEPEPEPADPPGPAVEYQYEGPDVVSAPSPEQHIEGLFARAAADRSKAFELKQELDRLGLFKRYEDRFLDLFRRSE